MFGQQALSKARCIAVPYTVPGPPRGCFENDGWENTGGGGVIRSGRIIVEERGLLNTPPGKNNFLTVTDRFLASSSKNRP